MKAVLDYSLFAEESVKAKLYVFLYFNFSDVFYKKNYLPNSSR